MSNTKQSDRDIRLIKCWPPGAIMVYDNRDIEREDQHVGFGLVVANDKQGTIWVLWDSGCYRMFCQYDVKNLNPRVIHRG